MGRKIDDLKMKDLQTLELDRPPMTDTPYQAFPKMVYRHPRKPSQQIFEIIANERVERTVATEHLTRIVQDQEELDKALGGGWTTKPYIPADLPDPVMEDLYGNPEPQEQTAPVEVETQSDGPDDFAAMDEEESARQKTSKKKK